MGGLKDIFDNVDPLDIEGKGIEQSQQEPEKSVLDPEWEPREQEPPGPQMHGTASLAEGGEREQELNKVVNTARYDGIGPDAGLQEKQMWGADYTTMSVGEKFNRSLLAGVGQVIGQSGDLIQFAGGLLPGIDMVEGNLISDTLQKMGADIQDDNLVYTPKELDEFTWAHLGNIEFWATDIAKQIPQIIQYSIPGYGGAALGRTALSKLISYGLKKSLIKGAKHVVTRDGIRAGGWGLAGKLSSETAEKMAGMVGAGITVNMMNSATIAGDALNRAKKLGLDDEQARWVASNTFMDNTKWMLADMISWGITFGKMNKPLLQSVGKFGEKEVMSFAEKIGRGGFRRKIAEGAIKGGYKGTKVLGVASLEGMEEQFQEVYEEWVTEKNLAEAQGKEIDDYWEYFNSPHMKKTRGIAFAAGLFGASVPSMINEIAESSRVWENKKKFLEEQVTAPEDLVKQRHLINRVMADVIVAEEDANLDAFLQDLKKKGTITEEQYEEYKERGQKVEGLFLKSQLAATDGQGRLNKVGGRHLFNLMIEQDAYKGMLEATREANQEAFKAKLELIEDPKAKKKAEAIFQEESREQEQIINSKIEALGKNINDLVAGKKQGGIPKGFKEENGRMVIDDEWWDENWKSIPYINKKPTNEQEAFAAAVENQEGLSEEQFTAFTKEGQELSKENLKEKGRTILERGKDVFNRGKSFVDEKMNGKKEDKSNKEEFVPAKSTNDLPGEFQDKDGRQYTRTPSGEYVRSQKVDTQNGTRQKKVIVSDNEAIKQYNESAGKVFSESQKEPGTISGESVKPVKKSSDLPKSFSVGNTTYEVDEDGDYMTEDGTGLSAEQAMNVFNKGAEAGTVTMPEQKSEEAEADQQAQEQRNAGETDEIIEESEGKDDVPDGIVRTFFKSLEPVIDQIKGKTPEEIKTFLKKNWQAWKQTAEDLQGNETINNAINIAANKLKGIAKFATNEGLYERREKRAKEAAQRIEEQEVGPQLQIDLDTETQKVGFDLAKFGGMERINRYAAARMPYYSQRWGSNTRAFEVQNAIVVNERMRKRFGPGVNLVLMDNIAMRMPENTPAYVLGATIFVKPGALKQETPLYHELLHVHYALNPNDRDIKEMTDRAMQNKRLVKDILNKYADQKLYEISPNYIEQGGIRIYKQGDEYIVGTERVPEGSIPDNIKAAFEPYKVRSRNLPQFQSHKQFEQWAKQTEQSTVTELPLEQQDVIREEVYVASMQSTVGMNYDIYFQDKEKRKNEFRSKKIWKKIHERVSPKYAKELLQEEKVATSDAELKQRIMDSLGKMDTRKGSMASGPRFMKTFAADQIDEMQQSIDTGINQLEDHRQANKHQEIIEANQELAELAEMYPDEELNHVLNMKDNRGAEAKTTSRFVVGFLKDFNQGLESKNPKDAMRMLNKEDLVVAMRNLSKESTPAQFALEIRESQYIPYQEFVMYLDKTFGSQEATNALLASMHKTYASATQETPFQIIMDEQGGTVLYNEEALINDREDNLIERVMQRFQSLSMAPYNYWKGNKTDAQKALVGMQKDLINQIQAYQNNANPTYQETLSLFRNMFPNFDQQLRHEDIMGTRVFYKGQKMPFVEALNHLTANILEEGKAKSGKTYQKVIYSNARDFIRGVVVSNRKFTLNDTVMNPEGNPTNTFTKQTYLRKREQELNSFYEYVRNNPNVKFKSDKRGKAMTMLRKFFVDRGGIMMESFAGVRNLNESQHQKYSNMNENSFAIASLLRYLGDPTSDTYMQTLGVASNSQSHYAVRVPKLRFRSPEAVQMAKEVNELTGREVFVITNGVIDPNKGEFGADLKGWKDFKTNNKEDIEIIPQFKDSALNIGTMMDAIFSNIVNKSMLQQEMFGDIYNQKDFQRDGKFDWGQFTKRFKNSVSPVVPLDPKTRLDIFSFSVPEITVNGKKIQVADADSFMTPRAAGILKKKYGLAMNVGDAGAFKTMSYNQGVGESGVTQIKTMSFVLTDELINENPFLAGLRDAMEIREQENSKNENYFAIAATHDAIKQSPTLKAKDNTVSIDALLKDSEANNYTPSQLREHARESFLEAARSANDKNNAFHGYDGSNFGVMQEMDLGATQATTPTQLWANLLTAVSQGSAEFDRVIEIQKLAQKIMGNGAESVLKNLRSSGVDMRMDDLNKIAQHILTKWNGNDNIDAYKQVMGALKSLNLPYVNEDAYNTVANMLSREGNKIITPGGYAFQSTDLGYSQIDGATFSPTLKAYEDGKPAEAVVPLAFAKKHGLEVNDTFIASRIPSHGPQTTGVFKVKAFAGNANGSTIIVNSEFSDIIGSDHDGDALYINVRPHDDMIKKERGAKKQKLQDFQQLFDLLEQHLMSPEMQADIKARLDNDMSMREAFGENWKVEKEKANEQAYQGLSNLTMWGEAKNFTENVPFKKMVGIAAQSHRIGHLLRAYNIDFDRPVRAGSRSLTKFANNGKRGTESIAYRSQVFMNVVLDNASLQYGNALGITPETVNQYGLMIQMGFTFKEIKDFMKSDGVKAWNEVNSNRDNVFFGYTNKTDAIAKAKQKIAENRSLDNVEKEGAYAVIDQMSYLDDMNNDLLKVMTILSGHKKLNGDYQILKGQRKAFDEVMKNKGSLTNINKLKKSPEVNRYLRVADEMISLHERTNIMATPEVNKAYESVENAANPSFRQGESGRSFKKNIRKVLAVRMMENKPRDYYRNLTKRIAEHKANPKFKNNAFIQNMTVFLHPNPEKQNLNRVYMSRGFMNADNLTTEEVDNMRRIFTQLPAEVQEDFFHYDMLVNGFEGKRSLHPFFPRQMVHEIARIANRMALPHTRGESMLGVENDIAIINSEVHPKLTMAQRRNNLVEVQPLSVYNIGENFFKNDSRQKEAVMKNSPHYITMTNERKIGSRKVKEHVIFKYVPINDAEFAQMQDDSRGRNQRVDNKKLQDRIKRKGTYVQVGRRDLNDVNNSWLIGRSFNEPTEGVKKKPN